MNPLENVRLAARALRANTLRSSLTVLGIVVGVAAMVVGAHVAADEPRFAVLDGDVAVLERDLALPEGLHLGPAQDKAGLEGLEDLELVTGLSVGRDDLDI